MGSTICARRKRSVAPIFCGSRKKFTLCTKLSRTGDGKLDFSWPLTGNAEPL
jgi:hypothetical protein